MHGYNELSFEPLRWNTGLRVIRLLDRSALWSLAGLQVFGSLERLGVSLSQLESLEGLDEAPATLAEVEFEGCRSIDRVSELGRLPNLTFLNLSECGDVEPLSPLRSATKLEALWVYGSTRITDGDLSPILEFPRLRELRMKSRAAYHPSVAGVQQHLDGPS